MANADIRHRKELMAAAIDPGGGDVPPAPALEPTAIGLDLPSASGTG